MAAGNFLPIELEIRGRLEGSRRFKNATQGLRVFTSDLTNALTMKEMRPVVRRNLIRYIKLVEKVMRDRHSTPFSFSQLDLRLPQGARTGKLAKRSGRALAALAKSAANPERVSTGTGETALIKGPFYLITHEEGRTIRGKPWLTIPLPAAMNSNGTPKRRSARDWQNLVILGRKGKGSKQSIVIGQKRGGKVIPLYVLKRQVRIAPRLGLAVTLRAKRAIFIDLLMNDLLADIARKAVRGR